MQENGDNDNNGCTKGMICIASTIPCNRQKCTLHYRMLHYHDLAIERASKLITKMCNNARINIV